MDVQWDAHRRFGAGISPSAGLAGQFLLLDFGISGIRGVVTRLPDAVKQFKK